jgi:hypothetical protein
MQVNDLRWLTIFLDFPAGSFDAGVAFWREATGYGLSAARGADGELAFWAVLTGQEARPAPAPAVP